MQAGLDSLEWVEIGSLSEWRLWLEDHHEQQPSVWVVLWKKGKGPHVPLTGIVDEALCFGWIDSLPRKLDADRSMLLLSPRGPQSAWSAVNKAKVERLIAEGRMAPAGLAKVADAKANGRWDFLDDVDSLTLPADLVDAFSQDAKALAHWEAFSRSSRRGILEWIKQARRSETRARRIADTVSLARENVKANHPLRR